METTTIRSMVEKQRLQFKNDGTTNDVITVEDDFPMEGDMPLELSYLYSFLEEALSKMFEPVATVSIRVELGYKSALYIYINPGSAISFKNRYDISNLEELSLPKMIKHISQLGFQRSGRYFKFLYHTEHDDTSN